MVSLNDKCREDIASVLCGLFCDREDNIRALLDYIFRHINNPSPEKPLVLLLWGPLSPDMLEMIHQLVHELNGVCGDDDKFAYVGVDCDYSLSDVEQSRQFPCGGLPKAGYGSESVFSTVKRNPVSFFEFDLIERGNYCVQEKLCEIFESGKIKLDYPDKDGLSSHDLSRSVFIFTIGFYAYTQLMKKRKEIAEHRGGRLISNIPGISDRFLGYVDAVMKYAPMTKKGIERWRERQ